MGDREWAKPLPDQLMAAPGETRIFPLIPYEVKLPNCRNHVGGQQRLLGSDVPNAFQLPPAPTIHDRSQSGQLL